MDGEALIDVVRGSETSEGDADMDVVTESAPAAPGPDRRRVLGARSGLLALAEVPTDIAC